MAAHPSRDRAAGAATALQLARLGHDVVLVDRAVFPADTIATHQIARTGVVQLHRWGLLKAVLASGAPPIRQVTLTADGQSTIRSIKDTAPFGQYFIARAIRPIPGAAPQRTVR